ncbi:MAG: hypothetical protein OXC91_04225 [Rhodobacteraceae bacterium]|nr:hypothetical protein [Paracoccaceae bacterium]
MALNANLNQAKRNRKDEFYTQLTDIEKELSHYKDHFRGRTVYYNCDDPRISNFLHHFSHNFDHLGLKKLITTCYRSQNTDLFSRHDTEQAIMLEYDPLTMDEFAAAMEELLSGNVETRSGSRASKEELNWKFRLERHG